MELPAPNRKERIATKKEIEEYRERRKKIGDPQHNRSERLLDVAEVGGFAQ